MNAQSTPVRKRRFKTSLMDSFSKLTPIKPCGPLQKTNLSLNGDLLSAQKNEKHVVSMSKSQRRKRKKNGDERKLRKKLLKCEKTKADSFTINNSCCTLNEDSQTCSDECGGGGNWCSEIKKMFNDSFEENLGCLQIDGQFSNLELPKLVANADNVNEESKKNYIKTNSPKFKVQKLSQKSLKNDSVNEPVEKMNDVLRVSDVMKWSDDSLLPKDNNLNLSDQIKKKLLENVTNKEVLQSQTTGWTQLNSSSLLKAEKSFGYQEIGPFYGLPSKVQKLYEEHKGIKELYSWQHECLKLKAVQNHENLVYALPTSGGKTLVAEILILREILCYKRNVLFILPYVSIVQEKIRDFSQFALDLGFLVEEYAAGKGVIPPRKRRRRNSILIATIEKALIIVNSLIEAKRLHEFGLIVVDELHMLSEERRGAVLESLLTQVIYKKENIQIIGMTATIGNLEEIAKFLKAESYVGNFRPVSLQEYVKSEDKIYSIEWTSEEGVKEVRTLPTSAQGVDPDGIAKLVQEVIPKDSVLIFCPTKKNCENVALLLTKILPRDLMKYKEGEKKSLYRALITESSDQICPILRRTLSFGIAYHHSGLTGGEKKLIEESFRDGTLSVICCTSTLAVGVNLPAKRVILRSPYVGKDFISLSKYKQMVGRAGRSGFGSEGESFLVCQTADLEKVRKLLRSEMDETTSKIDLEACKDLVLSSIGLGTATTRRELRELLACSMLHVQAIKLNVDTKKMADTCISGLYKQGALKIKSSAIENETQDSESKLNVTANAVVKKSLRISNDSQLMISRLGRAAMKGGLSLEKAHELYGDLIKAQSSLVLLTNLHLLYLITPPETVAQIKPNFSLYFNACMQLSSNEQHTAKVIGITEFVMSKLAMGIQPKCVQETVVNRFYVSLMLNELWKQQTIWDVATHFQLPRGLIQTLMVSASTFANCVLRFCEELEEFWSFKSLLTDFSPRLAHCCSAELLPLMDLPAVKRGRAKQLYEAGFKTLNSLAGAKPSDLTRTIDHLSLKVASQIIAAAKLLLMEKAENLQEEAEDVLAGLAEQSGPKEM